MLQLEKFNDINRFVKTNLQSINDRILFLEGKQKQQDDYLSQMLKKIESLEKKLISMDEVLLNKCTKSHMESSYEALNTLYQVLDEKIFAVIKTAQTRMDELETSIKHCIKKNAMDQFRSESDKKLDAVYVLIGAEREKLKSQIEQLQKANQEILNKVEVELNRNEELYNTQKELKYQVMIENKAFQDKFDVKAKNTINECEDRLEKAIKEYIDLVVTNKKKILAYKEEFEKLKEEVIKLKRNRLGDS